MLSVDISLMWHVIYVYSISDVYETFMLVSTSDKAHYEEKFMFIVCMYSKYK